MSLHHGLYLMALATASMLASVGAWSYLVRRRRDPVWGLSGAAALALALVVGSGETATARLGAAGMPAGATTVPDSPVARARLGALPTPGPLLAGMRPGATPAPGLALAGARRGATAAQQTIVGGVRPDRRANAAAPVLEMISQCESGGDPRAVSRGGRYRGKYQFDVQTWISVGGSGDPARASEAEQDRRAASLLARRGVQPWPVCGRSPSASSAQ